MTKLEFKQFLNNYKNVNEIVKKIAEEKCGGWEYMDFHISGGRIVASTWLGEDGPYEEVIKEIDVTKEVLAELIPDDLIF